MANRHCNDMRSICMHNQTPCMSSGSTVQSCLSLRIYVHGVKWQVEYKLDL